MGLIIFLQFFEFVALLACASSDLLYKTNCSQKGRWFGKSVQFGSVSFFTCLFKVNLKYLKELPMRNSARRRANGSESSGKMNFSFNLAQHISLIESGTTQVLSFAFQYLYVMGTFSFTTTPIADLYGPITLTGATGSPNSSSSVIRDRPLGILFRPYLGLQATDAVVSSSF